MYSKSKSYSKLPTYPRCILHEFNVKACFNVWQKQIPQWTSYICYIETKWRCWDCFSSNCALNVKNSCSSFGWNIWILSYSMDSIDELRAACSTCSHDCSKDSRKQTFANLSFGKFANSILYSHLDARIENHVFGHQAQNMLSCVTL